MWLPRCLIYTVILLGCHQAHGYGWWVHQPYDDTDEYNVNAEYLSNVTLTCEGPDSGYTFEYWIMPDMTVAEQDYERSFNTLDGPAGWKVSSTGEMQIKNIHEDHFGFYTCRTSSGNMKHAVKRSVNVKGAYFGDLWLKYRMPTIIGLSAACGFLVISVSLCLLYNYKVYGPGKRKADAQAEQEAASEAKSMSPTTVVKVDDGVDNKAFEQKSSEEATAL